VDESRDCGAAAPLLADLALGAAFGHERATALLHVASCPACRRDLTELSSIGDDLLLLVPEREPPAGFEAAVLRQLSAVPQHATRQIKPASNRRSADQRRTKRKQAFAHRRARVAALVAAMALAAGSGAAAVWWHTASDRQVAAEARNSAAEARTGAAGVNGAAAVTPVRSSSGAVVGHFYVYPGTPPWAVVSLTAAPQPGNYTMTVRTTDGRSYVAGVCTVTGTTGTTAYALTTPPARIAAIELSQPGVELTVHPG
jgi:hypothetical protein